MSQLMTLLLFVLAFIAILGPLVALHEWGHYIVARLCGVKVLTYSIGFGPKLTGWTSKRSGIDYRISALPLGGYVKMLDEREGEVADDEKHLAFNNQHPLKKIAIVAAGPIMNFIIAIALFWVLFLVPSEQLNTRIGSILPDTPAATANIAEGEQIVSIDGHAVKTWEEINYRLADRMGETGTVTVSLAEFNDNATAKVKPDSTKVQNIDIPIKDFMQGEQAGKDTLSSLGILPWQPHIEPVIGQLTEEGAALRQGLQIGDKIVAINAEPVTDWLQVTRIIRDNPETVLNFSVLRQNASGETKTINLQIQPEVKKGNMGERYGQIGAGVGTIDIVVPDDYKTLVSYDPISAVGKAFTKTGQLANMTLNSIGKMITGKVGLENLSGPVTIAVISKQSFEISWQQVLANAAIISLSLAVLNLLPIPALDGGHLLYSFLELIRGKPVPERLQIIGVNIGFLLLFSFMILAITNDFSRYF